MSKTPSPEVLLERATRPGLPPIHLWHPEISGELDMRIARDGTWFYQGSAIKRKALARLFSTILRREEDDCYYMVTPVEKYRVDVEDAPLVAVDADIEGEASNQRIRFHTNLDDQVTAGPEFPIWVDVRQDTGEPSPYVLVRDRLPALVTRSVFYRLVNAAEEREGELWLHSDGARFSLGRV